MAKDNWKWPALTAWIQVGKAVRKKHMRPYTKLNRTKIRLEQVAAQLVWTTLFGDEPSPMRPHGSKTPNCYYLCNTEQERNSGGERGEEKTKGQEIRK